jgi:hypothetical protein
LSQAGVSATTIAMIERKNQLEGNAKKNVQEMLGKQEHLREIDQHCKLAEGIRMMFMERNGKPISMSIVLSHLADKTRGVFTAPSEM